MTDTMHETRHSISATAYARAESKTPDVQAEATERVRAILVDDVKEHLCLFSDLCVENGQRFWKQLPLCLAVHELPLFRLVTVRITPLVFALMNGGFKVQGDRIEVYNETARFIDECRRGRQTWPYSTPIGELPTLKPT